ncbi:hypothetical protein ACWEQL_33440 [Kitasatospora sp. NPDC004240]
MPIDSIFCKIYVTGLRESTVTELLEIQFGTTLSDAGACIDGIEVEVRRNPDSFMPGEPSDFVLWPLMIEIEAGQDNEDRVIDETSKIIKVIWENSGQAVASCDFEDRLPWSGGVDRVG